MSSEYLFNGMSEYDTPADAPRSAVFRLMLESRWYFYWNIFSVFCESGRLGRCGKLDAEMQIRLSSRNLRLVENCGGTVHVRGLDHLRALNMRPVVLVGNHMSLLETGLFHAVIRPYVDFAFVVKESLMKTPFFKDILAVLGVIPVSRSNPREDLKKILTEGKRILESGKSMIVFPQATRSRELDPEHFNSIGVKLARAAGVPVVPFALKTDFLDQGKWLRSFGPVHPRRDVWFDFGEAMEIEGHGQKEQEKIIDFIAPRLKEWRRLEAEKGIV